MPHIVILDGHAVNPGDLSWGALEALGTVTVYPRTAPDEVVEHAREADILLTNKSLLPREVLVQLPRLRYVGVLATGYNVVDVDAARELGIPVCNIPAYGSASVAQMVFAHLLAICNGPEHYADRVRQGAWAECPDFCFWDAPLIELAGKRMGIVGMGNIGRAVARIAHAFDMEVWAVTSQSPANLPAYVQPRPLDEVLAGCHVVSLHCPLCADTHHLINERTLALMRPDAILINTGRGPLVDDEALARALAEDRLGAYAADVLTTEPPTADQPLLRAPRAYLTPHIAWATREARSRLLGICFENIRAFLNGAPQNVVNP